MKEKLQKLLTISKHQNLLYVEDNQEARDSTTKLLERFFDNITTAIDGQDGFDKFNSSREFDLIITDINMPNLNGIEMISKIREVDNDILIIILSAHNEKEYLNQAIDKNAPYYLTKPLKLPELIETLLSTLKIKEPT